MLVDRKAPIPEASLTRGSGARPLSAVFASSEPRLHWPVGTKVADWSLALLVFLTGFVMIEPTPGDLLLVVVIIVWAAFGLTLNRYFMPSSLTRRRHSA